MARPRIAVCVLALLIAEWPGAAQARRHLAHKRGRPVSLDPEPAVRLLIHRTIASLSPRGVNLRPCHGAQRMRRQLCLPACRRAVVLRFPSL